MSKAYSWEGTRITQNEKEDIVRACFMTKGWKRDSFGNMNKGCLRVTFVFDKVRLKKRVDGHWVLLKTSTLENLYRKLK